MLKARLSLEPLDSRDLLSVYTWTGMVSTDAANMSNWSVMQEMIPGQPPPPPGLPDGDDELIFGPMAFNSRDCDNLTSATDSFATVRIQSGYNGTVALGEALTFGVFDLASGAIAQPTSGTDLSITGAFTWTGGTLNNTPTEAAVRLTGAVGIISAGNGNTIATGSALTLDAGANIAIGAGTVDFSNGSPLTVDNGTLTITAPANESVAFTGPEGSYIDGKAKIELKAQGNLLIRNIDFAPKNRLFVNNGGNLTIKDGARAAFGTNAIAGPIAGTPLVTDILQNSGNIYLHSGCRLTSGHGVMELKEGKLIVVAEGGAAGTTATIGCQMTLAGGKIMFTTNTGTLKFNQDLYWLGGTVIVTVDCAANGTADQLDIDGKLHVGGTATLSVVTVNYNAANGLGAGFQRKVIYAKKGVVNVVPNQAPSLAVQNPVGGPIFALDLRVNQNVIGDGSYWLIPGPGQN